MYKGTNKITNKGLEFKLTNFISFGESVISAGFNQKTVKADLHVRVNNLIPPWNLRGKVLEDFRWHHTEVEMQRLPPASRPAPGVHPSAPRCYVSFPLPPMMHLHRSLCQFDPRAHVASLGLYNQALPPWDIKSFEKTETLIFLRAPPYSRV
jgi:hypothetical protein